MEENVATRAGKSRRTFILIALVIACLLGGALVYYGTNWGPWTDDDSSEYFEAARNFASGYGMVLIRASGRVSPLASRPPFYAVVLSIAPLTGIDLLVYVRWLNICLFVGFLLLMGPITFILFENVLLSSLLLGSMLVSSSMLINFTSGLAEPLFFLLGLASLLLILYYLRSSRHSALYGSAILAGLSTLTRLSGAAVIGAGAIAIIVFSRKRIKRRFLNAFYYCLASLFTLTPWLYGVFNRGSTPGSYQFDFNNLWGRLGGARIGFTELGWSLIPFNTFLPNYQYRVKLIIGMLMIICAIATLVVTHRKRRVQGESDRLKVGTLHLASIFSIFTLIYIFVFLFSHLFMQIPQAMVIQRHLSPIEFGAIIAITAFASLIVEHFKKPKWGIILLLIVSVGLVVPNAQASRSILAELNENGRGYTSKAWHQSDLIQIVSELPDDLILISNEIEAIIVWTNRAAYRVPEVWNKTHLDEFERFGDNHEDIVQQLFSGEGAALVLFNSIQNQFVSIYGDAGPRRLDVFIEGLIPYYEGTDGTIYFYDEGILE